MTNLKSQLAASDETSFKHLFKDGREPSLSSLQELAGTLPEVDRKKLAREMGKQEYLSMSAEMTQDICDSDINRRGFLGKFVAGAASLAAANIAGSEFYRRSVAHDLEIAAGTPAVDRADSSSEAVESGKVTQFENGSLKNDGLFWKQSIFETVTSGMWESALGFVANVGLTTLAQTMGIRAGNAHMSRAVRSKMTSEQLDTLLAKIEKDPMLAGQAFHELALSAPFREELIYRLAPSALLRLDSRSHWEIGVPAAVVFALAHNVSIKPDETGDSKLSIDREWIPLPQFLGGLIYWHLNQRYGVVPAIAAHSLNNLPGAYLAANGLSAIPRAVDALTSRAERQLEISDSNETAS